MTGERIALVVGVVIFVGFSAGAWFLFLSGDDSPPGARVEWTAYRTTDDGLVVTYDGGACEDGRQAVVEESDDRIQVTVWVDDGEYVACPAILVPHDVPVTLEVPVGDREVVDGLCVEREADESACVRQEKDGAVP